MKYTKSLQTSCLPYKCFPQDYLKIKKENFKHAIWKKKKRKQINNKKTALSYSRQTTSKYTLIPHSPTPSFLHQSSYSRHTLKLWAWESPPAPSTILQAHELPPFNTTIYKVSKLTNPFAFWSSPCSFAVQHQVDTQSIPLINPGDSWLFLFVLFSCWGHRFRIQSIQGKFIRPLSLPCSWQRPAKINLRIVVSLPGILRQGLPESRPVEKFWSIGNITNTRSWSASWFTLMLPSLSLRVECNGRKEILQKKGPCGLFEGTGPWFCLVHTALGFQFIRTTSTTTEQKEKRTDQIHHHKKNVACTEASPDFVQAGKKSLF